MSQDTQRQLATLLSQTSEAHDVYEKSELNGVFDQNWSGWYATYIVQHGLGDLLGKSVTAEEVGQLLKQYDQDYKQEQPGDGWPYYYAQRLIAHFG